MSSRDTRARKEGRGSSGKPSISFFTSVRDDTREAFLHDPAWGPRAKSDEKQRDNKAAIGSRRQRWGRGKGKGKGRGGRSNHQSSKNPGDARPASGPKNAIYGVCNLGSLRRGVVWPNVEVLHLQLIKRPSEGGTKRGVFAIKCRQNGGIRYIRTVRPRTIRTIKVSESLHAVHASMFPRRLFVRFSSPAFSPYKVSSHITSIMVPNPDRRCPANSMYIACSSTSSAPTSELRFQRSRSVARLPGENMERQIAGSQQVSTSTKPRLHSVGAQDR